MATNVDFKFSLDEVVIVNLTKERGMISFLGFDEAGPQYFVKTKDGGAYWKESQLTQAEG